jgi:hypothetical protein
MGGTSYDLVDGIVAGELGLHLTRVGWVVHTRLGAGYGRICMGDEGEHKGGWDLDSSSPRQLALTSTR